MSVIQYHKKQHEKRSDMYSLFVTRPRLFSCMMIFFFWFLFSLQIRRGPLFQLLHLNNWQSSRCRNCKHDLQKKSKLCCDPPKLKQGSSCLPHFGSFSAQRTDDRTRSWHGKKMCPIEIVHHLNSYKLEQEIKVDVQKKRVSKYKKC